MSPCVQITGGNLAEYGGLGAVVISIDHRVIGIVEPEIESGLGICSSGLFDQDEVLISNGRREALCVQLLCLSCSRQEDRHEAGSEEPRSGHQRGLASSPQRTGP